MSSAVAGYTGAFGSDGPPPVLRRHRPGRLPPAARLQHRGLPPDPLVAHPPPPGRGRARHRGRPARARRPREAADLHLPVRPGADLPLLSAMLAVIDGEGLRRPRVHRAPHRAAPRRRWRPRASGRRSAPRRRAASPADADRRRRRARFGTARRAMALWSMGANQSTVGTLKNRALINLCLATGNIGRPGTGPLSLTGQPNAMGGRETGGLAHLLPGYRKVDRPRRPRRDAAAVGHPRRTRPASARRRGSPATELVEALEADRVKAVWIVATNPVVSLPDAARFAAALRRAELVDRPGRLPPDRDRRARARRPARGAVGGEGRARRRTPSGASRSCAAWSTPPGEALPDWEIFARVGARARPRASSSPGRRAAEVYAEYVRDAPRGGCATRPASRTSGCGARARCSGRCPRAAPAARTTTAPSASTPGGASRRPTAARAWRRRRTPSPPSRPTPTSRSC